jgi:hypothetical protein
MLALLPTSLKQNFKCKPQPLIFGLVSNSPIRTSLMCLKILAKTFHALGETKPSVNFIIMQIKFRGMGG